MKFLSINDVSLATSILDTVFIQSQTQELHEYSVENQIVLIERV